MMQQLQVRCTQVEALGQGRVRVHLSSPVSIAVGKFVSLLLPDLNQPLRRVAFPSQTATDGFTFDLPPGDDWQSLLLPGSLVDLIGPLGSALPDLPSPNNQLLIANADPSPLLPLTTGQNRVLLLGRPYPLSALPPELEVRVGHLPSLIRDYAQWAQRVLVATEPTHQPELWSALLAAGYDRQRVFVLHPVPMPCGVGACQACVIHTKNGAELACQAGPWFALNKILE